MVYMFGSWFVKKIDHINIQLVRVLLFICKMWLNLIFFSGYCSCRDLWRKLISLYITFSWHCYLYIQFDTTWSICLDRVRVEIYEETYYSEFISSRYCHRCMQFITNWSIRLDRVWAEICLTVFPFRFQYPGDMFFLMFKTLFIFSYNKICYSEKLYSYLRFW